MASPRDFFTPYQGESKSVKSIVNIKLFQRDLKNSEEPESYRLRWNEGTQSYDAIANHAQASSKIPMLKGKSIYVVVQQKNGEYQFRTQGNQSHYFLSIAKDDLTAELTTELKNKKATEIDITEIIKPSELRILTAGDIVFSSTKLGVLESMNDYSGAWYHSSLTDEEKKAALIQYMSIFIEKGGIRLEDVKRCYKPSFVNNDAILEKAKASEQLIRAEEKRIAALTAAPTAEVKMETKPVLQPRVSSSSTEEPPAPPSRSSFTEEPPFVLGSQTPPTPPTRVSLSPLPSIPELPAAAIENKPTPVQEATPRRAGILPPLTTTTTPSSTHSSPINAVKVDTSTPPVTPQNRATTPAKISQGARLTPMANPPLPSATEQNIEKKSPSTRVTLPPVATTPTSTSTTPSSAPLPPKAKKPVRNTSTPLFGSATFFHADAPSIPKDVSKKYLVSDKKKDRNNPIPAKKPPLGNR